MAHLQDLEELIASVHTLETRDYMKEAICCYMAGAYRACIVLTFIALFDDITKKLNELGKVNKKARTISQEIEKRKNEQDIFESYLLDQLKAHNLIPVIDYEFYSIVKTLRNKSAHPSGHKCSAEEARFVMYEAINRFMKNPNFSTTQVCDEILSRIGDENFFPSNLISHTMETVQKEMEFVHEEAIAYLLEKLIEKYLAADKNTARNCEFFINGLARANKENYCNQIYARLIEKKITSKEFHAIIFSCICANAIVIKSIDKTTLSRLKKILSATIKDRSRADKETLFNHSTAFFRSLIDARMVELITSELKEELEAHIEKFAYGKGFLKKALPEKELYAPIVKNLISLAGSSTFTIANEFADHIEEMEEIISEHLTDTDSFRLIASIDDAADTGAWSSKRIRDANFEKIPKTREKASQFSANAPDEAKKICEEINEYRKSFFEDLQKRIT